MPLNNAYSAHLYVNINNLRSDNGVVYCSLFNKKNGFPSKDQKALVSTQGNILNQKSRCTFTDLEPGEYAVSAIHDEDNNGKFKMKLFMPAEGWGVSNDAATQLMGPPKYKDSKFNLSTNNLNLDLKIRYGIR